MQASDVAATADLLARALDDDPAYGYLLGDARERTDALRAFFRRNLQVHLPFRCTFVAKEGDDVCATVTVRPPEGFRVGALTMIRHGLLPFAARHGARAVRRLLELKHVYDGLEREAAKDRPHWHVHMMAVEPRLQGRGVGSTLLESVLRTTVAGDARRRHTVLTTHKARNVVFYERHGFEIVGERAMSLGSPYTVTSMCRALPSAQ